MPVGNSRDHLHYFLNKITTGEPFGIIRPADGEFRVLCNETLTNCDNWTFQSGSRLASDLFNAIQTKLDNLYIGIPCDCCSIPMKQTYENSFQITKERRTYANLFCNANWKTFIQFCKDYEKGLYIITSGKEKTPFYEKGRLEIDELLVNHWDIAYETETHRIMAYIKDISNELICFSAGPLSKIWIPLAMQINPTNTYLDVGSTFDLFTKGKTNRYYTKDGDGLEKLVCNFTS